ncbi:MAG: tetratricopeptide repeat protein [Bacteroidales bacterium]|nr:tetratricopeptide repeat protein [Bacteroidales bacterium]
MDYRRLLVISVLSILQYFSYPLCAEENPIDSLLSLLTVCEEAEKAKVLNELAYLLWQTNTAQSIEYAKRALSLAEEHALPREKYKALNNMALAVQKHDTLNESLQYNTLALEAAREMNDSLLMARALFELGTNYSGKGYYGEALENLLQSFRIVEDLYTKSDTIENSRRLSFITNNIGNVFSRMGDKDKALEYYTYSLDRKTVLHDSTGIANVLNNIGLIYAGKAEFEKAEAYYQQSLKLKRRIGNPEVIAETVFNIWELFIQQEQYLKALSYFDTVQTYFYVFNSKTRVLMFNNIASVYLALDQPEKAYSFLIDAVELAKRINNISLLGKSYLLLSEIYFDIGDFQNAYACQAKYITINDSFMNREMVLKMAEMQTKYETEKKEKQIAILQKDRQLRTAELRRQKVIKLVFAISLLVAVFVALLIVFWIRANQKRKQELLEKRNLENEQKLLRTQMTPHFIFNSLNSVQGFISANNSFKAMSFLSKFGQLLRNVLDNSRKSLIDLKNELDTLRLYIEMEKLKAKDGFDYEILADKELDMESILIPPLIIQPFVENAIKHGLSQKKEKGKLLVEVKKVKQHLKITIKDDGIGRKKSAEMQQSTKKQQKSFGMELSGERLENLEKVRGEKAWMQIIDLSDSNGESKGTMVILTIPCGKDV